MISPKIVIPIIIVVVLAAYYALSNVSPPTQTANNSDIQYIKEFSLPAGTAPNAILPDGDTIWVIGSNSKLIKFDSKKEQVTSTYQIGQRGDTLMSWTILKDNDGFVWFARLGDSRLWRFDPNTEEFMTFPTSAPAFSMRLDKDTGQIWFATLDGGTVGVVQKTGADYNVAEFGIGANTTASSLFVRGDVLLVSELASQNGSKISEFSVVRDQNQIVTNITKSGQIPFPVFDPTDVLVFDDVVWFTEHGSGLFASFDKNTKELTRFPTSENKYHSATLPLWIRPSSDGSGFWFNEHGGNRVGFFNVTDHKLIEYEIPSRPAGGIVVYPLNIAADPYNQNKAWFSEWNTDKIAVLDRSVPIPFDIDVIPDHLQNNGTTTVKITNKNKDQVLSVNATSWRAGDNFVQTELDRNTIRLKSTDGSVSVQLAISGSISDAQNRAIAVSATNGVVTKSAFVWPVRP
jgi:streptogramin lyase